MRLKVVLVFQMTGLIQEAASASLSSPMLLAVWQRATVKTDKIFLSVTIISIIEHIICEDVTVFFFFTWAIVSTGYHESR